MYFYIYIYSHHSQIQRQFVKFNPQERNHIESPQYLNTDKVCTSKSRRCTFYLHAVLGYKYCL